MARTRSKFFSKYISLTDTSLLIQERFISHKGLGETLAYSIIMGKTGISIDPAYDEMIRELLDKFPIFGWRTYILTCMTDIISEWKNTVIMNTGDTRDFYYYGMPGVEHNQDLFYTKLRDTRGMFLTSALSNVLSDLRDLA